MRVLVAPDKFKGTLTAAEAAEAIGRGWRRGQPTDEIEIVPMADGGEGTLDALVAALGGDRQRVRVSDPLGDPVEAEFGIAPAGIGTLAIVEMARASGLALISAARRDPKRTTTRGTGELILEACRREVDQVLVCIGGSATNDGGAGMAQALGVSLWDDEGRELGPGGAALLRLVRIDMRTLDPAVRATTFIVGTDVNNPLIGPNGASAVYGPQKGASPEDVVLLDRALAHFAAIVHRDLGIDLRHVPGAGAAGGLGAGLVAFLGARVRPGVDVVMEAVRLPERLARADVVITGEGTFDDQSFHGKAPAGVLRAAKEAGVPALVFCGQSKVSDSTAGAYALADRYGLQDSMDRAQTLLEDLAAEVAGKLDRGGVGAQVG
jgi:glycerate kinase